MLPERPQDLDLLIEEIDRQIDQVQGLISTYDTEALKWRPNESRWSITGQIAHLILVNGPYQKAMVEVVAAQPKGSSAGPWKHPWFSRTFAKWMEPPVTRRYRTMKAMIPDIGAEPETEAEAFYTLQRELRDIIDSARGLDLGRIRLTSPFARLMRFSLGGAFGLVLGHNRRHIWLAEEVVGSPGFPGRG